MVQNISNKSSNTSIITNEFVILNKDGEVILKVHKLDDDDNIHLETKTEVFDGPADLLLKQ